MTRTRQIVLGLGVLALALAAASWDGNPAPAGSDPLTAEAVGLLGKVYDVSKWGARVPVKWAAGRVGRLGLTAWVTTLPLPTDVRGRIESRLDSPAFVDEIVPFALFVKGMYTTPDEPDFATWARSTLKPTPGVPGWEHSLFSFTPAEEVAKGGPGIDRKQASRLLQLYDAVYLQDGAPTASTGDVLVCDATDELLAARMERAKPLVRELLEEQEAGMGPGDLHDAVTHILGDDNTLEATTLSLVDFVNAEVCKHYRIFASQVMREQQVNDWLGDALLDSSRQEGWDYLKAHGGRRHAVQFVVDGLEGHLVAALASGAPHDPFLLQAVADEAVDVSNRPTLASTQPQEGGSTAALHYAAENGASQPLPSLAKVVASAAYVRHGISTTPTISVRNLPIAKTGAAVAGPNSTGIPNFHFVDRSFVLDGVQQGRPWYFYGNDALQLTALTQASGMKTMFERLQTQITMSCGAQYDEAASYSIDSFLALAIGESSRDFADVRCVAELERRAANEVEVAQLRKDILSRESMLHAEHHPWELYDRWAQAQERGAVLADVQKLAALIPEAMPDYLLYYDPWPDHFAHAKGPFADEIVGPTGELVRLDHWLGRVLETYTAAGVQDLTLYGMAGDHGLTPVHWLVSPEAEFVDGLAKSGKPLIYKKISSDEGEGPKLTHRLKPPSMRGLDLVVASTAGGNYMMDFFVDQDQNWARQPLLADLRAFHTLGGATLDVPAELLSRLGDSLDYLVLRGETCTPEGGVTVAMGPRGGSVSTATIERRGARVWVGLEGTDLLGLAEASPYETQDAVALAAAMETRIRCVTADRANPSSWCTEDEWRALTQYNGRPDAVNQLAHLYDTDRAGTVNLFPRSGVGYNTKVPGRHAGESFLEKDAFVGLWGTPVTATGPMPSMVNGAVPMALNGWLTGTEPQQGVDGWGWPAWPKGTWSGE